MPTSASFSTVWLLQVEVSVVDEPQLLTFKGTFKLASEPRGTACSAALAAAETVLVSKLAALGVLVHRDLGASYGCSEPV